MNLPTSAHFYKLRGDDFDVDCPNPSCTGLDNLLRKKSKNPRLALYDKYSSNYSRN